jgi:ferredoxin
VIALDKHGEATPSVDATDDEAVLKAAAACPMGAIAVHDTISGRQAA